jgi:hypothetical protein
MKRYPIIPVIFLFLLSACTFLFPTQTDITVDKIEYQGADTLTVYLRSAEEGYFVTVNGEIYDCEMLDDPPGVLKCSGPSFQPGEKVTIRFYKDDQTTKPFASLDFVVPEYDPELLDSDGDGQPDAEDLCPADPLKSSPGVCGCGKTELDSDADGTPDCQDQCPANPAKTAPDENSCDIKAKDSDEDGSPDSSDLCPQDPDKTDPGVCGCGTPDADLDNDGIMDCEDQCPIAYSDLVGDPCDKDEDNDGVADGADQCPYDPYKKTAGYCGCGFSEADTDKDGTPDCVDLCPKDKNKIEPGKCGCGVKDKDSDGDGIVDCKDPYICPESEFDSVGDPCNHDEDGDGCDDSCDDCPFDPDKTAPGICGCGVIDKDSDGDGTKDCLDGCPSDPLKTAPGSCGCGVPEGTC